MPPPPASGQNKIYSATYSHVPVYEFTDHDDQIMRRRADDYINATHILKAAGFDKPARTRILEREVQKGVHEKVQGGYGKYQGTWIPLNDARVLAHKHSVLERLGPIFDYVPGDRSPPPAPKNTTSASSKPRAPRAPVQRRAPVQDHSRMSEASFAYGGRETPDHASMRSGTPDSFMPGSRHTASQHRKRKRDVNEPPQLSYADQQHMLWTDELLDYFMLQNDPDPPLSHPDPPEGVDLNRAIDEKGHTPMHWAAAMGDLSVVTDLVCRGARIDSQALNGETPLMRAVLFTNNFDKGSMAQLMRKLIPTIQAKDVCQSTVFHHVVATTCSKTKYSCARYYLETILDRLRTNGYDHRQIAQLLDQPDQNGDTPVLIAARFGARKCVRTLINNGASTDIPNAQGQTADDLIAQLNARRRDRYGVNLGVASSSPVRDLGPSSAGGDAHYLGLDGSARTPSKRARHSYRSEAANILTSQLPTLITTRADALAAEFEKQIAEQEASVLEGAKALELRQQEVERLRRECESANTVVLEGNGADEATAAELKMLEEEVAELLEGEQAEELGTMIEGSAEKRALPNGTLAEEDQKTLAKQVLEAQDRRRILLSEMLRAVSRTGNAGLAALQGQGEQQQLPTPSSTAHNEQTAKYTRLIRSALQLSPQEEANLDELLPEMLRELEESKRDREEAERHGMAHADDVMDVAGLTPNGSGHAHAGYSGLARGFGAVDNGRRGVGVVG